MLIQDISEDTQPPLLGSCAGNFPGKEFPWEMTVGLPGPSQDGNAVGTADPQCWFN